ncbi:unnamed protein product [Paramecium octaurelia]|uniref:Uncharacterized protein n=1 Tax=Paramecium octaurelia TaxID=43137 RepID=A0A8S1UKV3_PAROT|nr:unnamed protein product [Paramecium octaurelia]
MKSAAHTVRIYPLSTSNEKDTQGNLRILSSRINFEDPTPLFQTRTLLANFITENRQSQSNSQPEQ